MSQITKIDRFIYFDVVRKNMGSEKIGENTKGLGKATETYLNLSQNIALRRVLEFFARYPKLIHIENSKMGNPYYVLNYLAETVGNVEHDRVVCGMLFFMGLRIVELTKLQKKDLDLIGKTVLIPTAKQRKEVNRAIPLDHVPAVELKLWNSYLMSVAGEKVVNVSRRTIERIVKRELGMHPHALRHALGLFLYEYTKDIRIVAQILRHTNIANTMIYTRLSLEGIREKIRIGGE